jgi:hypothetical protein
MGDGRRSQWPQLLDDLGDGQAGAGLDGVGAGQGGEHDGQVRFDGVAHAVEHGSGIEVGLGHAERLFDVPQVVIFDDASAAGITSTGMLVT